jgi:NSS family neurotransmitter:Na+ symporter
VPCTVLSLAFFSTTSGIFVLDIVDHFINQFGILLVAVVSMLVIAWGVRALPLLAAHLNHGGSVPIGAWWRVLISVVAPLALAYVLVRALLDDLETPYGDYPQWMLLTFGWGAAVAVVVVGFAAARIPWRSGTSLTPPDDEQTGGR